MEEQQVTPATSISGMDANTWAMLCHLAALAGFIGVPCGNVIGPLVVWLVKRDELPIVDEHGKEPLNFQISWTIYLIGAALLAFVVIGFVLVPLILVGGLVLTIMASIEASKGGMFRYPLKMTFIS